MMPPAIDSGGKPRIFGREVVVPVELFTKLVVLELFAGPLPSAGPPSIDMAPFEAPVRVRLTFAQLIETLLAGSLVQLPP